MRAYGSNHEFGDDREWPDQGDILNLGLSSKHGKQKSRSKRWVRRFWKKLERHAQRLRCERARIEGE